MKGFLTEQAMEATRTNTDTAAQSAHPDLRGWLQWLAATDRLAVARKGLSLIDELAAVAKKLENERAVLFPSPGQHSIPVVANLFADRSWIADSLGVPTGELLSRFQNAVRHPLPWVEVVAAPVQDVVHHEVDLLRQLPIPKHNEHDSGPYITAGAIDRAQSEDRNPERFDPPLSGERPRPHWRPAAAPAHPALFPHRRGSRRGVGDRARDRRASGLHSRLAGDRRARLRRDGDRRRAARSAASKWSNAEPTGFACQRMRKSSSKAASCRKVREPEGPFGEFPQYYGPRADREVIQVDAITHRKNPIFHTIVGGGIEHLLLGGIPREATLLDHLQRSFPSVRDVRLTRGGTCRYHLAVKIDKASEGEPKNIIMGAFGGPLRHQAGGRGRHAM